MKQTKYSVLCLGLGILLLTGCFRQDIVTVDIAVPAMQATEDRQRILSALSGLEQEAIKKVELDTDRRIATVTYDSTRLARKNIEHAIASAGYDANEVKAKP